MFQEKLLAGDSKIGLLLIVFSATLVLVAVFVLFLVLFKDSFLALIGALIFSLLPNKLEMYHIPINLYIDLANFAAIVSLIAALLYVEKADVRFLVVSLFSYTVAIFSYETGFLMPLVLLAYLYLYQREKLSLGLYFSIPSLFYLAFRFSRSFGLAERNPLHSHQPDLLIVPGNLIDLFHQYFGRSMVRSLLYGAYKFPSIEPEWLILIGLLNVVFIVVLRSKWLKTREVAMISNRAVALGIATFVFFLIPSLLNHSGGVAGRQLVLPSIGVAIFGLWILGRTKELWRPSLLVFVAVGLVVSQGNAWAQVVACRINSAVYETLKEKRAELEKAERIVIDTKSFAERIPFTWVERDFNVLNTYYGAQAFEDWGLRSMVHLVLGGSARPKAVFIATERPSVIGQRLLAIGVSEHAGYRSVSKKTEVIPEEGTIIIDFVRVFGGQFNNGNRKIS
jgi:hypothetical protein